MVGMTAVSPVGTRSSEPLDRKPLLRVDGLATQIDSRGRKLRAVDTVSFDIGNGEILGLVGESGCGKSMTALSIMRLLPPATTIASGSIRFEDQELTKLSNSSMRKIRGRDISMVFQEPMTALDPAFSIGTQLTETVRAHEHVSKDDARARAIAMLDRLGIPNAAQRIDDYPHQFSGGMRQRVMLAQALILDPKLLLADEPTTALDVTIQAEILDLLLQLRRDLGLGVLLITHNLGVVHQVADRVAVMYAGEIVEIGTRDEIFSDPQHPYTQGLLRSMPYLTEKKERLYVIPGRVPDLWNMPRACRFARRCPNRIDRCDETHPELEKLSGDHALRCYNPTKFAG
jgi:oligopeptide/dipeptide ABC transporter ATP-binding protein